MINEHDEPRGGDVDSEGVAVRRVNLDDLGRLSAFSHASVADNTVYVSGTLGTQGDGFELAPGGVGPQTTAALHSIERILQACGATWDAVTKVNVYLTDMATFPEMNAAYEEIVGVDGPARITIGCSSLALGAAVELDCIAHLNT